MRELSLTDSPFTKEHAPAARVLEQADRTDRRRYLHLLLRCDAEARPRVMEYLNGAVVKELPHGGALIQTAVVEDEQLWLGTLLSLGGKAEVLEPEAVRLRLLALAEGTAAVYREA